MANFIGVAPTIPSSLLDSHITPRPDFTTCTDPSNFLIPNVTDPAFYCRSNFASASGDKDAQQVVKFAKGTTTLAFKFNEGIIVSVDSRSTMGAYIASQTVKKIIEINPFLLGTMAGGGEIWIGIGIGIGERGGTNNYVPNYCAAYSNNDDVARSRRLQLLGEELGHAVPPLRAPQQEENLRGVRLEAPGQHHELLPRLRPLHGNHGHGMG